MYQSHLKISLQENKINKRQYIKIQKNILFVFGTRSCFNTPFIGFKLQQI